MCDAEPPSVMFEVRRKARKPHTCCECRAAISRGQEHEYVKGCWDGSWSAHRTCLACVSLRAEALRRAEAAYGPNACYPAFGHLREHFEPSEWRARAGLVGELRVSALCPGFVETEDADPAP